MFRRRIDTALGDGKAYIFYEGISTHLRGQLLKLITTI
jgi:hypothetical protein